MEALAFWQDVVPIDPIIVENPRFVHPKKLQIMVNQTRRKNLACPSLAFFPPGGYNKEENKKGGASPMSDTYGGNFVSLTDEEGNEI